MLLTVFRSKRLSSVNLGRCIIYTTVASLIRRMRLHQVVRLYTSKVLRCRQACKVVGFSVGERTDLVLCLGFDDVFIYKRKLL